MRNAVSGKPGLSAVLLLLLVFLLPISALAAPQDAPRSAARELAAQTGAGLEWRNDDTGFRAVIMDEIDLLTEQEERRLLADMQPLTAYGSVAFWSTDESASNEIEQARLKRRDMFGLESGSIFVINMKLRKVTIQSYGKMYDVLSVSRANSITNYVRGYLTRAEYYAGAQAAFLQMNSLMRGDRIAQPMKHLSNACIALMVGLMVMLGFAFRSASTFRRSEEAQTVAATAFAFAAASVVGLEAIREYKPQSDSSGSSCSSCSSGGGSSCSSCGGGGSSSF